ncbi:reverse transcriptase domain-containing protein [Tanacetum coccineum]
MFKTTKETKAVIKGNNQGAVYQAPPYQPPTNQPLVNQALPPVSQIQGVSKTDFESYAKANDANMNNLQMKLDNFQRNQNDFQRSYNDSQKKQDDFQNMMLSFMQNYHSNTTSSSGTLPSQTVTNPREHVNAITTRSGKTCEGPSTPLVPTPVVSTPQKEPEQNPETSTDKVQKPSLESTAQVPPPEEEESIFIEIPKPKAKKTVNVEIQDLNSPRPNSYQSKLPYPERMKVRENDKPSAQHSRFLKMFKQLRLEIGLKDALVEMPKFNKWLSSLLRNKEKLEEIAIITINAKCSAIIMNKVPEKLEDPRKFLIPYALQELDKTSALADSGASINLLPHSIYKQLGLGALTPTRMTLELANRSITHPMGITEAVVVRVDGFTFLADFVVVNFVLDPRVLIILGRHFLRTAKALVDLYEETLTLRVGKEELVYYVNKSEKNKDKHFVHAISVIDFSKNDPFSGSTSTHSDDPSPSSSTVKTNDNLEKFTDELTPLNSLPPGDDVSIFKKDSQEGNFQVHSNPLFEFDDNFKSSTINPLFDEMEEDVEIENSNEPELLQTPLSNKGECFDPGDDIDEIDAFLAIEISMDYEEGYYDSGGDVLFLESLLCEDTTHNFSSEVISDHDTSISFSPRSDPLHHEFAGELLTLPSRNDREFEDYLNHDLIRPGVENDDSEDEDIELPNNDHQDDPSFTRPRHRNTRSDIPTLVSDLTFILFLSSFISFGSEDTIFDPGISTFPFSYLKPVPFALPKDK